MRLRSKLQPGPRPAKLGSEREGIDRVSPGTGGDGSEIVRWTSDLGNAYYNQPQDLMEAVQVMRQRAQAAGNLQDTPQENVSYDQGNVGDRASNPQVVFEGPLITLGGVYGAAGVSLSWFFPAWRTGIISRLYAGFVWTGYCDERFQPNAFWFAGLGTKLAGFGHSLFSTIRTTIPTARQWPIGASPPEAGVLFREDEQG